MIQIRAYASALATAIASLADLSNAHPSDRGLSQPYPTPDWTDDPPTYIKSRSSFIPLGKDLRDKRKTKRKLEKAGRKAARKAHRK